MDLGCYVELSSPVANELVDLSHIHDDEQEWVLAATSVTNVLLKVQDSRVERRRHKYSDLSLGSHIYPSTHLLRRQLVTLHRNNNIIFLSLPLPTCISLRPSASPSWQLQPHLPTLSQRPKRNPPSPYPLCGARNMTTARSAASTTTSWAAIFTVFCSRSA